MLPPVEVKNFDIPTYLPKPDADAPAITAGAPAAIGSHTNSAPATGSPSTIAPAVGSHATSAPTISASESSISSENNVPAPSTSNAIKPTESAPLSSKKDGPLPLSEYTRKADISANYQPIQSITPKELHIDSEESISGPSLGLARDGISCTAKF